MTIPDKIRNIGMKRWAGQSWRWMLPMTIIETGIPSMMMMARMADSRMRMPTQELSSTQRRLHSILPMLLLW